MFFLSALLLTLFPAGLLAAAVSDSLSMTIPNRLCAGLALAFAPAALAVGLPLADLGEHLLVGFVVLLLGVGAFAAGWMGGGDAKLFAAVGLWLGWPDTGLALLYTALAGGALALSLIALRRFAPAIAGVTPPWAAHLLNPKGDLPYGVAIAAGALIAFPQSALFQALAGVG